MYTIISVGKMKPQNPRKNYGYSSTSKRYSEKHDNVISRPTMVTTKSSEELKGNGPAVGRAQKGAWKHMAIANIQNR